MDPARIAERRALRSHLLALREQFVATPLFDAADAALRRHLASALVALQPQTLGMYWPLRHEFNPHGVCADVTHASACALALPWCKREPRRMTYRGWDGAAPGMRDECGIAASAGAELVPDVVLAPCLGYTRGGLRLGYGGGYFDRFLAAHPHVTALGVAWSVGEIDEGAYRQEPHDLPMTLIVTEAGVVV